MTLIDENELVYEQEKRRKLFKILIRLIIVLIILCLILIIYRNIVKNKTFKCYVDGKRQVTAVDDLLLKDEKGKVLVENGNVYISIRKLSTILNCQFYNSEYKRKGEDKTKCQIKIDNIYTSYIANSNKVYKTIVEENETPNTKQNTTDQNDNDFQEIEDLTKLEFEYFTIDKVIRYENDELYASIDGIELGFDISVSYNSKNNTLTIYSLNHLEEVAKKARNDVVDSSEYSYKNKRLLKYGMVVVKDSEGNLGVGSYTNSDKVGSYVASCKYKDIDFNEGTKTLSAVASNDNKKVLLFVNTDNQEVEKNMSTQYSDIKEITGNFDYFLVKENGKYGIINYEGNTIIPTEFEEIGVKEENYADVTCKYIIGSKYIPVKSNGVWGLYNITGEKLIDPQYVDVGCSLSQNGDSTVIIPNLKNGITGIVFLYNKEKSFYGVYNADTGEKIAVSLTEVFKKEENDEENYYINYIIDRATSKVHTINLRTDL